MAQNVLPLVRPAVVEFVQPPAVRRVHVPDGVVHRVVAAAGGALAPSRLVLPTRTPVPVGQDKLHGVFALRHQGEGGRLGAIIVPLGPGGGEEIGVPVHVEEQLMAVPLVAGVPEVPGEQAVHRRHQVVPPGELPRGADIGQAVPLHGGRGVVEVGGPGGRASNMADLPGALPKQVPVERAGLAVQGAQAVPQHPGGVGGLVLDHAHRPLEAGVLIPAAPDGLGLGVLSFQGGVELLRGGLDAGYEMQRILLVVHLEPVDLLHGEPAPVEPGAAGAIVEGAAAPMKGAV